MKHLLFLLVPAVLSADGGTIQLRAQGGPFWITVFTPPPPLRVGSLDVSVLLEDTDHSPVLDAQVTLDPTGTSLEIGKGQNKLLYSGFVQISAPGPFAFVVRVRRGTQQASVAGALEVQQSASPGNGLEYVAVVPVGIALFFLNRWLAARRHGHRREEMLT